MDRMREKITAMETDLGIAPADTDEPEIYVGPFIEQEQTARRKRSRIDDSKLPAVEHDEDGESSDGAPLTKELTPNSLQLIKNIGIDINRLNGAGEVGEVGEAGDPLVFSSFAQNNVDDDAEGYAASRVPFIPNETVFSDADTAQLDLVSCPRTDSVNNGSFGLSHTNSFG